MSDADLARRALALLDLTDLADDATEAGTRDLCRRAVSGPVPVAVKMPAFWFARKKTRSGPSSSASFRTGCRRCCRGEEVASLIWVGDIYRK